ncbi:MAG: sigma-70 family RNA polymerase sigma factor [Clostridia bacterium]|nr:sigma-70 family RNA polymerase sigma factor [Clostridia bacterium]MBQ7046671.1 sigma-70 family RNA polymerase sigma factor [Oscillospiraceae bacterium]
MQQIEEAYKQYADYVYKYLMSLTHNHDISEELTQETFYQAVKNIKKFDGSSKITTWLCAIAKNQLLVYRRKHTAFEPVERIAAQDEEQSPEQLLISAEEKSSLYKKLHLLPEPFREILYLRLLAGLSFSEIGEIFGKTENWARVTYYRGKEKIKKETEKDEQQSVL